MNKKKVDVVIPVYHPGSEFKKLMERLERQTYEVNRIFLMHTTDGQSLESMKAGTDQRRCGKHEGTL